mgnify:CR=1 FL=1
MLDTGNTAWILISTALVLFMTLPGLALFYGGLVKSKNILILFGDTPLIEVKDIRKLVSKFKKSKAKASLIA